MKTILLTFVSGLFICLITASSVNPDLSLNYDKYENILGAESCSHCGASDLCTLDCEQSFLETDIFETFHAAVTLEPSDIEVYEIAEEVIFDFDTKKYLPVDFNPYQGMDTESELNYEAKLVLNSLVSGFDAEEILNIEALEISEIEEEVDLGFRTEDYLPEGFDPYKGMVIDETIDFELQTAIKAMVTDHTEDIINIEDIMIYELEEESL